MAVQLVSRTVARLAEGKAPLLRYLVGTAEYSDYLSVSTSISHKVRQGSGWRVTILASSVARDVVDHAREESTVIGSRPVVRSADAKMAECALPSVHEAAPRQQAKRTGGTCSARGRGRPGATCAEAAINKRVSILARANNRAAQVGCASGEPSRPESGDQDEQLPSFERGMPRQASCACGRMSV